MASEAKFACPACGKRYGWKPEIAGKKAKCKCGEVMSVPASAPPAAPASAPASRAVPPPPPPPPADQQDDLYGFREDVPASNSAHDGTCPSCHAELDAGAVVCMNCGYNTKTGQRMGTSMGGAAPPPPVPGRAGKAATGSAGPSPYPTRRAKIEQSTEKPPGAWKGYLGIAFGLALMGLGIYWMINFDPEWIEGLRGRRTGLIRLAYSVLGRWGTIAALEVIGGFVVFGGWMQASGKVEDDE